MKANTVFLFLAFIAFFSLSAGRLAAQLGGNPNLGNTGGLMGTTLTGATLVATTSDGQDVSGGLTITVGEPIPTVTFTLGGQGIAQPGSWTAQVQRPLTAMIPIPYFGIAPGLTMPLIGAAAVYRSATGGTFTSFASAFYVSLPNSSIMQLVGTPTQVGTFDIVLNAEELSSFQGASAPTFDYFIIVRAAPPTTFTTQPASQSVAVGQSATFTAAASGSPTYQWSFNGTAISGATSATLTLTNVQLSAAGAYLVAATVSGGSVTSSSATLTVVPWAAPVFTVNPVAANIAAGRSAAFSAAASGELPPTYQWNLNGTPIPGATDPILQVKNAASADAGNYTCTASNASGTVTSRAAALTVTTTNFPGYLINLSARASVGTGSNILFGGFGVYGTGTKRLLVRGAGPSLALAPFNISAAMATPQLTLFDNNGAIIASNLAWGSAPTAGPSAGSSSPTIASTTIMNSVGAFNFPAASNDTSMIVTAPSGNNTMQVSGVGGTTGVGLVEIYDADSTYPPVSALINLSARALVGTGTNILIGGFAIYGTTSETVLIRADGPTLGDAPFSISGVLAQPVLTIYNNQGVAIYSNTGWGGDASLAAVFPTVGAFNLNSSHNDSAVLISLPPGNYTAQVSGLNGSTGVSLVEIYDVP